MKQLLIKKTYQLLVLLPLVVVLAFLLMHWSPVDPIRAYIGADMLAIGPEQQARIAERWGLDQPMVKRLINWSTQVAKGNLGYSKVYQQPVAQLIKDRFASSFWLMAMAWMFSGVMGITLGVLAGFYRSTWLDKMITTYAYMLVSAPVFWIAILLLMVLSVWLPILPFAGSGPAGVLPEDVSFWQRIRHMILPALSLSIVGVANIILHTRKKMIEVLQSDYVVLAKAQGETDWGIIRHQTLKNSLLPAITLQFATLSELFGGAVLVEQVFSYPGLGRAAVRAGLLGDVPLLLGIVLFSALFVFVGNTMADVLYALIDPRIKEGYQHA